MTSMPRVQIGTSQVIAVASVHYTYPFALVVRELVANAETRPTAIAVELDTVMASAAWCWMRDLGTGTDARLPCMLGLAQAIGAEGRRVPADVLLSEKSSDEETVTGFRLLCLTPTDSIVEALRSGVRFGIPCFGIDLPSRPVSRPPFVHPDPLTAAPADYVAANAARAAAGRHAIDRDREIAMAERLKYLLERYERVLFVCGLGHWTSIASLLSAAKPAPVSACSTMTLENPPVRTVLHPTVALEHIDRLPLIITHYEKARISGARIDPQQVAAQVLEAATRRRFDRSDSFSDADLESLGKFEGLLMSLMSIDQQLAPNAAQLLGAASAVMSRTYCHHLAEEVLRFPWANRRHDARLHDLPVLVGAGPEGGFAFVRGGKRGPRLPGTTGHRSAPMAWDYSIPWQWENESEREGFSDIILNWKPIDTMFTAMSMRAMRVAK
jgi:hypothetical protein